MTAIIRGVITPIVTPFDEQGRLDTQSLRRLMEYLIESGVHALFVAGTTGEGMALPIELRIELGSAATEIAGERIPLVMDVGAATMEEVSALIDAANRAAATAVALQPPGYFPLAAADIEAFYQQALRETSVPLLLYHIPGFTNGLPLDVVARLAADPRVAGIKDSGGDAAYCAGLLEISRRHAFSVYVGDQMRFDALRHGAEGIVPSMANVEPEVCVRCVESAWRGDWAAFDAANQNVMAYTQEWRSVPWGQSIRQMKRTLQSRGILAGDRMCPIFSNEELDSAVTA